MIKIRQYNEAKNGQGNFQINEVCKKGTFNINIKKWKKIR
jgi:hypothetical protein